MCVKLLRQVSCDLIPGARTVLIGTSQVCLNYVTGLTSTEAWAVLLLKDSYQRASHSSPEGQSLKKLQAEEWAQAAFRPERASQKPFAAAVQLVKRPAGFLEGFETEEQAAAAPEWKLKVADLRSDSLILKPRSSAACRTKFICLTRC